MNSTKRLVLMIYSTFFSVHHSRTKRISLVCESSNSCRPEALVLRFSQELQKIKLIKKVLFENINGIPCLIRIMMIHEVAFIMLSFYHLHLLFMKMAKLTKFLNDGYLNNGKFLELINVQDNKPKQFR